MPHPNALSLASLEGPDLFCKNFLIYFQILEPSTTVPFGVVVSILDTHQADTDSNPINSISFFIFLS